MAKLPPKSAAEPITPATYLDAAQAPLKNLAVIALDFEGTLGWEVLERVGAIDRLMAAEKERSLAARRPSFLRLVVDNTVRP